MIATIREVRFWMENEWILVHTKSTEWLTTSRQLGQAIHCIWIASVYKLTLSSALGFAPWSNISHYQVHWGLHHDPISHVIKCIGVCIMIQYLALSSALGFAPWSNISHYQVQWGLHHDFAPWSLIHSTKTALLCLFRCVIVVRCCN